MLRIENLDNARLTSSGIDPESLYTLDAAYDVHLEWSAAGSGRYDALLVDRTRLPPKAPPIAMPRSTCAWHPLHGRPGSTSQDRIRWPSARCRGFESTCGTNFPIS